MKVMKALHDVCDGDGPSYLRLTHFSQIESIPVAGQVNGLVGALR
jgi:hypothetical protein